MTFWRESVKWTYSNEPVYCVACSPVGSQFVAVTSKPFKWESSLRQYDFSSNIETVTLTNVSQSSLFACYSSDGNLIGLGSEEAVRLYDHRTKDIVKLADVNKADKVYKACFSPGGSHLFISRGVNGFCRLNVKNLTERRCFSEPANAGMAVCNATNTLVVAGGDWVAVLHNLTNVIIRLECRHVRSVCISSDGSTVVTGQEDGRIQLFSITNIGIFTYLGLSSRSPIHVMQAYKRDVTSLSINSTDTLLVSSSLDGSIKIWYLGTLELVQSIEEHPNFVWSVCFGPRDCIVSGSHDGTVRVWKREEC